MLRLNTFKMLLALAGCNSSFKCNLVLCFYKAGEIIRDKKITKKTKKKLMYPIFPILQLNILLLDLPSLSHVFQIQSPYNDICFN